MNSIASTSPYPVDIQTADRLSLTVFVALAIHAIIILGVSFNLADQDQNDALATMEITLVHNKSTEEPDEADYLAQANQLGGGNIEQKVRDSSPFSNTMPTLEKGIAPDHQQELALPKIDKAKDEQELMTVDKSRIKEHSEIQQLPLPELQNKVTAAQLFESSQEIARISAEIKEIKKSFAMTPRRTYVHGVAAKEYRFASYMDAWRNKVERIGNLNYPEEAVRKGINGNLLMDVAINPDGSIHSIKITRSSGHKVLDKAAKRIVRLSAPFPPLTKDILQDTDILHIPRVWHFRSSGLSTSN